MCTWGTLYRSIHMIQGIDTHCERRHSNNSIISMFHEDARIQIWFFPFSWIQIKKPFLKIWINIKKYKILGAIKNIISLLLASPQYFFARPTWKVCVWSAYIYHHLTFRRSCIDSRPSMGLICYHCCHLAHDSFNLSISLGCLCFLPSHRTSLCTPSPVSTF